jgi:uncharacterized protein YecE (DUF72 family)
LGGRVTELRIGPAGWTIPSALSERFPEAGPSLERYATRFGCAEINSTFHRSHRRSTYERWAASTPARFSFAAKLPKTITHQCKLVNAGGLLAAYLDEVAALGDRLAVHLVQLPPSLAFDEEIAAGFFDDLNARAGLRIACEPRHPSWFTAEAGQFLAERHVARVAADPARVEAAGSPGGWAGLTYFRLHGSPAMYRSSYDDGRLELYADRIRAAPAGGETWCIFDNTASSAATGDALKISSLLEQAQS